MSKITLVKTWRLLPNELLTDEDVEYLVSCNLATRTKSYSNEFTLANSSTKYYYNNAFELDVTTIDDEQEALFLLRFSGRFSLLHVMQMSSSFHSFNV